MSNTREQNEEIRRQAREWLHNRSLLTINERTQQHQRRRENPMSTKVKQQLTDTLKRVSSVYDDARKVLERGRIELAALDDPRAQQRLTKSYRDQRRREIQAAMKKATDDAIAQALALASATLASGEALTGTEALLRGARFLGLEALENDGSDFYDTNKHRQQVNEFRLLREELMRGRIRDELLDADPGELSDMISEYATENNLAALNIARRVVRKRNREQPGSVDAASRTLTLAITSLTPPEDAQQISGLLDQIEGTARKLTDVLGEIDSGKAPVAPREFVERLDELVGEHGESDGVLHAVEEREKAQRARQTHAEHRANEEVKHAILADESDAAAIQNRPAA